MRLLKPSILLLLFSVSKFSFSQNEKASKKEIEISASHFFNIDRNAVNGIAFTTEIGLKSNKSLLSLGPVWWIDKINDISFFRGGVFSYKYFVTNDYNKPFSFYFTTDVIYTFEKLHWKRYEDFDVGPGFSNVEFTSKLNSLKLLIGYGFNWNINDNFYLYNQVDLGIEFYNSYSLREVENYPQYKVKYSSGGLFSSSKPAAIMKFGLGYRF